MDKEIWKNKEYSRLLLIGEGPCEERIKELVRKNKLEDMVIFLGSRKDVNDLYSAMDVFLFPSLNTIIFLLLSLLLKTIYVSIISRLIFECFFILISS